MRYRARLSEVCDNQVVITIDTEQPCLLMYPLNEWELVEEQVDALPSFHEATKRIKRLLLGHATDVEVDANGRFLLSSSLRQHANLNKKAVLIGQGKKFEIWDEVTWNHNKAAWLMDKVTGDLPQALTELSL